MADDDTLSVEELAKLLVNNIHDMQNANEYDKFAFGMELALLIAVEFAHHGDGHCHIRYESTCMNVMWSMQRALSPARLARRADDFGLLAPYSNKTSPLTREADDLLLETLKSYAARKKD